MHHETHSIGDRRGARKKNFRAGAPQAPDSPPFRPSAAVSLIGASGVDPGADPCDGFASSVSGLDAAGASCGAGFSLRGASLGAGFAAGFAFGFGFGFGFAFAGFASAGGVIFAAGL